MTSKSTKTRKRATPGKTASARGDRSKRLLDLVMLLLRARTPVTFREIRDQFVAYQTANVEAGLRAFERDKADLLELGVPVRYITPDEDDALEEGGYVIDLKRYRMPEVELTVDEVSALVLAAAVARAMPGGHYPKIVDLALKKLAFDLPEAPDTPMELLPSSGQVGRREPVLVHFPESPKKSAASKELSDRFAQIEAATRNRKRLTITYRSASSGHAQTRDVDPYGLVYRQGSWLLVGWCHLRKGIRSFRVDRVTAHKTAPKPKSPDFERPEDFDVRAYASRSPWTFATDTPEEVELLLGPDEADTANEDFGPDAVKNEQPDGSTLVRFSCGNPDFAISKILAAKGSIVIREGARLEKRLADELVAIEERYR